MTAQEIEEWAVAYIEAQSQIEPPAHDDPLWWPIGRFFDLEYEHPDECWACILAVLWREPPAKVLAILSAGPLEHLIHYHGERFIERVEAEAKADPAFRALLHGVWECTSPEIWARVQKARGRKG